MEAFTFWNFYWNFFKQTGTSVWGIISTWVTCVYTHVCVLHSDASVPSSSPKYVFLCALTMQIHLLEGCSHLFILLTVFSHLILLLVFLYKGSVQPMLVQWCQLLLCFSETWQRLDFANFVPNSVPFQSPQRSVQVIIYCIKELWLIQVLWISTPKISELL